jgi:hypothetical protein
LYDTAASASMLPPPRRPNPKIIIPTGLKQPDNAKDLEAPRRNVIDFYGIQGCGLSLALGVAHIAFGGVRRASFDPHPPGADRRMLLSGIKIP